MKTLIFLSTLIAVKFFIACSTFSTKITTPFCSMMFSQHKVLSNIVEEK